MQIPNFPKVRANPLARPLALGKAVVTVMDSDHRDQEESEQMMQPGPT